MDFVAVAQACAPNVHIDTISRIAEIESAFNPYAIGVVGGRLQRQPHDLSEAIATAQMLESAGYNYSVGIAQVNRKNLPRLGLTLESAFDPCRNLHAGATILEDCYRRAGSATTALTDALSCYYTGNFKDGYRLGYVAKVKTAKGAKVKAATAAIPVVPDLAGNDHPDTYRQSTRVATSTPSPQPDALLVSRRVAAADATENTTASISQGPATALLF